eukprot:4644102-Pleurochrysis_carterae.AAC.1
MAVLPRSRRRACRTHRIQRLMHRPQAYVAGGGGRRARALSPLPLCRLTQPPPPLSAPRWLQPGSPPAAVVNGATSRAGRHAPSMDVGGPI